MTGEIINLRQARKRKARSEREKKADDNRIKFGRTKSEKKLTAKTGDLEVRRLEAHRLDRNAPKDGIDGDGDQ
ncbi:DUF4169 family protein [Roseibium sp.]|uniref:DUF4169 family protein n=1 Tax=Roseibium sp. TaxID=1936156 RepID=UPI003A97B4AB